MKTHTVPTRFRHAAQRSHHLLLQQWFANATTETHAELLLALGFYAAALKSSSLDASIAFECHLCPGSGVTCQQGAAIQNQADSWCAARYRVLTSAWLISTGFSRPASTVHSRRFSPTLAEQYLRVWTQAVRYQFAVRRGASCCF